MPTFLLNLLGASKLYIYGITAMAVFGVGCYITHQWDASALKSALQEQEKTLTEQCNKAKKITEDVSHDYETQITALNSRVSALKLRPKNCVPITRTATRPNGSTGTAEHGGQDGVNSDIFYDYAALAEKYRLQIIGLQEFIKKSWGNE